MTADGTVEQRGVDAARSRGGLARILGAAGAVARRLPASRYKRLLGRAVATGLGRPPAVRADVTGLTYWLAPADRTQASMFWDGSYDDDLAAFLVSLLDPDSVVLDVGANVGLIAARLAAELGRMAGTGRVVAVEPVRGNARLLARTVAVNGLEAWCDVVLTALGETCGEVRIVVEGRSSTSGNAIVGSGPSPFGGSHEEMVGVVPLDELAASARLKRLDLVKIDVEGAEVGVLRGGRETIGRTRPVIVGEFNAELMPRYGTTFLDAMEVLSDFDYRCFAFASDGLVEVTPTVGRGDVCLVPADKVERVLRPTPRAHAGAPGGAR